MEDYYKILGIQRLATPEEVKKAYFVMAKKYHPDSGDETEIKKFHEVAEAYKTLSDKEFRKVYDLTLEPVDPGAKKVETELSHGSVYTSKRESYRDDELKEFHKNRYKKAVLRVIGFSLLVGLIGYIATVIIGDTGFLGGIAGLLIGFSLSINKNFNIESFFTSVKSQKAFRFFNWFLFLCGFGYFVWLIVRNLF